MSSKQGGVSYSVTDISSLAAKRLSKNSAGSEAAFSPTGEPNAKSKRGGKIAALKVKG